MIIKRRKSILFILVCLVGLVEQSLAQTNTSKPRTIVTTDGEVDDVDSFIRMLLYANEFDIVGWYTAVLSGIIREMAKYFRKG
jgi:hypothetical protein